MDCCRSFGGEPVEAAGAGVAAQYGPARVLIAVVLADWGEPLAHAHGRESGLHAAAREELSKGPLLSALPFANRLNRTELNARNS